MMMAKIFLAMTNLPGHKDNMILVYNIIPVQYKISTYNHKIKKNLGHCYPRFLYNALTCTFIVYIFQIGGLQSYNEIYSLSRSSNNL